MRIRIRPLFPLLLCVPLAAPVPAAARQATQDLPVAQAQERAPIPAPPRVFQIPIRAQVLADSAAQAEQTIRRLASQEGIEAEIREAEQRQAELQALLVSMVETEFVRLERLSRLRDQALLEDSRLDGLRSRLASRLSQLGEVHAQWVERRGHWRHWHEVLREDPDFERVESDVVAALQRIDEVLGTASGATSGPLELQRRVEELRVEIENVGAIVTTIRAARREALLERSQPLLFSPTHFTQIAEEGWRAWDPTASIEPGAYLVFLRGHLGFLGFHAFLAILVGVLIRWLRTAKVPDAEWAGLLEDPWALGILTSVVVAMMRITLAPPLWDVFLWALFGATAAVLSQQLFQARALRLTVYLLAAFYPVLLFLEVAQLPEAVFRVGLSIVAACAVPVFLLLARHRDAAQGVPAQAPTEEDAAPARMPGPGDAGGGGPAAGGEEEPPRDGTSAWGDVGRWPLRIGAGIWILVLVIAALGFDALARWLLHSTMMSAAVVFVGVLSFAFVHATAVTFSRLGTEGPLMSRAGVLLGQRFIALVRIAVVAVAALVLLDVWGIAESPVATWRRIMETGFTAGTLHITIGRILLGVFVVYMAVLLSDLVRSFMGGDMQPARPGVRVEPSGLGDSISRLAHYALITVGVILALAVMGVELQNFAIVAGALGIGVGFGLQNVVNNFASGLILLFERPVRVGDTVIVGDVWGTIQKIGLRSTIMVTFDQSEMIVPNGDLVSEKVINWTLSSPIARIILPVGVAYGSPIARVKEILEQSALSHHAVLKEPPPEALFMGFGDSSLDFELRVWVENIRLRLQTRSVVLTDIERRLAEEGIEVPFPQRDLHLRSVDGRLLKRLPGES